MAWYHELGSSLAALFRRRQQDTEMDEEIRFHLEMETQRYVHAGIAERDAQRRARRDFGGVERHKEGVRDARGANWFFDAWSDVRFALRSLRQRPGLTGAATLTLALGVGATSAVFGVLKSVLLTPLPYGSPERVVVVWSAWKGFDQTWLSYDEWEGWKARVPAFADIGLYQDGSATVDGDSPERVRTAAVQASVLPILGVKPERGRNFTADEDRPSGPRVVILSHELWERRFGGDPSVVGRQIQISGNATMVVGIMPPDVRLPLDYKSGERTELWFPMATDAANQGAVPGPEFPKGGASHGFYAVARLAPGATAATANAQLRTLVAELEKFGYMANVGFHAYAVPVEEQITGRVRPVLLVVFGAVVLVLLIACANVAGLLLVRGETRRRELAVRVALGAGGRRLARLLIAESAVLAALGCAAGIALATVSVRLLRSNAPAGVPRVAETSVDWTVLLFALVMAVVTALITGVLPLAQAAKLGLASELREGGRGATSGRARLRWRQLLVAAEIALAVVLVAGAGLMIRTVRNLLTIDPGFRPDGVLTMRVSTPSMWYPDSIRVVAFWDDVERRVAAIPGVKRVGAARLLPLASEMGDWGLVVEGYTPPMNQGTPGDWQVVTPGYLETMGVPVREGRTFDARDGLSAPLAMIVNRTFEQQYFVGRRALGGRVRIGGDTTKVYTIVGVVDDVRHNTLVGAVKPQFYATLAQFAVAPGNTRRSMSLVVRTDGDPKALIASVRGAVKAVDPRLAVSEVRTMRDIVNAAIGGQRFAAQTLAAFGVLALILSAIGIFGIVSQVVASRVHEFGVRAALGATPRDLMAISLGSGLRQTTVGLGVGIVAALVLTRALRTMLSGVTPTDPVTFAAVVVVTGLVAVAASLGPAWRAGRIDPNVALRVD
ncbi:MAG TPA: ABC transporter permease [Gemmatimonadaceae bacterium]|jgi:predicted permease|nr:ABC transporter permease [Gemmatimonadaceae bacterium]